MIRPSNRGLVLRSLTTAASNDLTFSSTESAPEFRPSLSFPVVDPSLTASLDNSDIANLAPRRLTSGPQAGELVGLPRLQNLNLNYQQNVKEISSLAGMKELTTLRLDGTGILPAAPSTLSTLAGLTNLQTLNLPTGVWPRAAIWYSMKVRTSCCRSVFHRSISMASTRKSTLELRSRSVICKTTLLLRRGSNLES